MSLARRSTRLGLVTAFAVLALSVPTGLAQSPDASPAAGDGSHPAHIHSGTCAELGDIVAPLEDVGGTVGESVGPESAFPVKQSRSVVDLPLQDIIDGGHAINVHLSNDDMGTYIACGDIGGELVTDEDGRTHLILGLGQLNDSGHSGVAWLGADGEQTEVVIQLIEPDALD